MNITKKLVKGSSSKNMKNRDFTKFEERRQELVALKAFLKEQIKLIKLFRPLHFQNYVCPITKGLGEFYSYKEKPLHPTTSQGSNEEPFLKRGPILSGLSEKTSQKLQTLQEGTNNVVKTDFENYLKKVREMGKKMKERDELLSALDTAEKDLDHLKNQKEEKPAKIQQQEQKVTQKKDQFENFHNLVESDLINLLDSRFLEVRKLNNKFVKVQTDYFVGLSDLWKEPLGALQAKKDHRWDQDENFQKQEEETVQVQEKKASVPLLVVQACQYLTSHITTTGLFQESANTTELKTLKILFASNETVDLAPFRDPYTIAGLLLAYFRDNQNDIFPVNLVKELIAIEAEKKETPLTVQQAKHLMANTISEVHLKSLAILFALLEKVALSHSKNGMDEQALAACWAPCLFAGTTGDSLKINLEDAKRLFVLLIANAETFFAMG